VIHPQPLERVSEKVLHRDGPGVHADSTAIRASQRAELHGEDRLVATVAQGSSDEQLVVPCGIVVAGVEQCDAGIERGMNRRDAFALVRPGRRSRTCPCTRAPAGRRVVRPIPAGEPCW
jgi:hypothetical protein